MADIFISYSREDESRIHPLIDALEKQGWTIFWDRHIPAGKTWRSYIEQALKQAKCVVVVWSKHSINSKWVAEEADVGQHREILVPIVLDSVKPPIGFRSIQTANLSDWNPVKSSKPFDKLIDDISEVLKEKVNQKNVHEIATPSSEDTAKLDKSVHPQTKAHRYKYIFVAILFALIAVIGFWAYQLWFSDFTSTKDSKQQGLVFATKIETNGEAIDPNTTFNSDITDLYAVFRSGMAPPGMDINVENPLEGKYYAYLKVNEKIITSKFGWRWYLDGKIVNDYQLEVKSGDGVWLQRWNYDGQGIFEEDFSPGKYTIVILIGGNPAMSSELTIKPKPPVPE